MIHIFNTIEAAQLKLLDMIQLEEERQRPYFVDNDFFNNKYNFLGKLTYYCIKEREVTEWKTYSKEESKEENKNKILYFSNYKKSI